MTKSKGIRNSTARKEAKEAGQVKYNNGIPCIRGHLSDRLTSNGACLECISLTKSEKDAKHYKKNAEKIKSRVREYRQENIEKCREDDRRKHWANRDRNIQISRERYAKHRDEDVKRKRDLYRQNAEEMRAKSRERYKNDPKLRLMLKVAARKRKARLKGADGSFSAKHIEKIRALQKCKCAWCSVSLIKSGEHIDHIMPVSKGGSNWPSNLQLLCPTCNLRKRDKIPEVFAREEGRLL